MKNYVKEFLNNVNINSTNTKFLLAVSTGIDSMALLTMFLELNKNIVVVHINHGKREQSFIEEEFISKYCFDNKIKCYIKRLEYKEENFNFQSVARKMRYDYFIEIAKKENVDYIVLAHHANDNIETCLMRMLRGSSLAGYSGMHQISNYEGFTIIRPLLKVYKEDLMEYQKEKGFTYFEDCTNSLDCYTRNRIRKEVLPVLINEESDLNEKIFEFSETLYEASLIVKNKKEEIINKIIEINDDGYSFKLDEFKMQTDFMKIEILFELLKKYDLSKASILEIIKIMNSNKKNYEILFKDKFYLIREYDLFTILLSNELDKPLNTKIVIDKIGKYIVNDTINVSVIKKSNISITNLRELCYNTIKLPIIIRTRQDGDRIKVGDGYQKVKDLLIDKKVGIRKRKNVLLAVDKDGEVLIVFGYKKSSILSYDNCDIVIKMEENNG